MLINETTVTVNRPPDEVFATMVDLSQWGAWMDGHISVRQVSDGPLGPGTKIRHIFWLIPPIRGSALDQVTAFERNKLFEYTTLRSFAIWARVWWSLDPVAQGTRVTLGTEARFDLLIRWMEPLFANEMKRSAEEQAQKLKRLFEGSQMDG